MLIINITVITSVAVTLLYNVPVPLAHPSSDIADVTNGSATQEPQDGSVFTSFADQQSGVIKAEGRVLLEPVSGNSACLKRVLLFAIRASGANFIKLLRDMKNEQCFSQVFSKQEFLLCQCCAYEGNLFLWARFWMLYLHFLTCRLGYLGKV